MQTISVGEQEISFDLDGKSLNKSWTQLHYLYIHLNRQYPEIWIPACPEAPKYSDEDYMRKKQRQVERFISKILSSTVLIQSSIYAEFISSDLTVPVPIKGKSWFTPYDKGFLSATFPNNLPIDVTDIKKHKDWILNQQEILEELRDNVKEFVTCRMIYAESIKKLSDCNFEYLVNEDTSVHEGLLQDMVDLIGQRSLKHYAIEFGDTVQEYLKHLDELKVSLNNLDCY
eukprot:NODE_169_length_16247_cov_0.185348.p8 type:complete len:229 gc:universal NODE_169_length_16247_cov_0.185348:370-1056(+)